MPFDISGAACRNDNANRISGAPLSVFQIMPRGMYFGASKATSIDLCVRDFVSFSQFQASTRIFAAKTDDLFDGFNIAYFPGTKHSATLARANYIAKAARRLRPDLIAVQQHLPTAAALAMQLPQAKIVLHTHNFQKSYAHGSLLNFFRRAAKRRRYRRLAGIVHVSEACENAFAQDWPSVRIQSCVINNGLDFEAWRPAKQRLPEILFVGRCAPEKGIVEAAEAIAAILPEFPDWRARFILSHIDAHAEYFEHIRNVLDTLGAQITIELQRPFEEIKQSYERAAIALVPSKWLEPFGRTALEAHAGGAALISSGRGGLAEISRESALYVPDVSPQTIAGAIEKLITDETLRSRLANAGAEQVRIRFDIRAQAARLDRFYRAIARGNIEKARSDTAGQSTQELRAAE